MNQNIELKDILTKDTTAELTQYMTTQHNVPPETAKKLFKYWITYDRWLPDFYSAELMNVKDMKRAIDYFLEDIGWDKRIQSLTATTEEGLLLTPAKDITDPDDDIRPVGIIIRI